MSNKIVEILKAERVKNCMSYLMSLNDREELKQKHYFK